MHTPVNEERGVVITILASLVLVGCTTYQYPARGATYVVQQGTYVRPTTYNHQTVRYIGGPLDNTGGGQIHAASRPAYEPSGHAASRPAYEPSRPSTSRTEVGSDFSKKLAAMKSKQSAAQQASQQKAHQQALVDRERRINEFLWKNEIPGLSDTRILLKNTINSTDRKLAGLAKDIRLAGRSPETDQTYLEILDKRNRMKANLDALDVKIMDVIVSDSAGAAAESAALSPAELSEVAAARSNLQSAALRYKTDAERMIKSANW